MDTLTVVFTGLMIFDFQGHKAYPVEASGHEYLVTIGTGAPKKVKEVKFEGLAAGASSPVENFSLLSLAKLVGKEVDAHKTYEPISLNYKGALRPYDDFDVCTVGTYSALSWRGVQWDVQVQEKVIPLIVLDGTKVPLTNLPQIRISNDYPAGTASHLPMYRIGARDKMGYEVTVPKCDEDGSKAPRRFRNPITCPPVSLK